MVSIALSLIIVNELLILVIKVITFSFAVANFVTYEKVLIMMLRRRRIFPNFEILVNFLEQVERT